jgi:multiple sugar transport system permease protein
MSKISARKRVLWPFLKRGAGGEWFFPWFMVGPAFIVILAIMIYPLVDLGLISLRNYGSSTTNFTWVGTKWYQALPSDPRFVGGLVRTLEYSAGGVAGSITLGTIIALILNRNFWGVALVRTLFILPMVVMPVASALMWGTLFNPSQGILNFFLQSLGLKPSLWLASPDSVLASLLIVEVWMGTPFAMLIILAGLRSMPLEPFEAAEIDGASKIQQFIYLTLPLLRAALGTAILFRMIDTLKQFPIIWVLTQGGPLRASETLYVYGYNLGFQFFDLGYGATVLMVLMILTLVLSGLWMRIGQRSWV